MSTIHYTHQKNTCVLLQKELLMIHQLFQQAYV